MKENYFQDRGRPHLGLEDPEQYGLTQEQVIDLMDSGKWNSFRRKWKAKQKLIAWVEAAQFICPNCGKEEPDPESWKRIPSPENRNTTIAYWCFTCWKEKVKKGLQTGGENKVMYSRKEKCILCRRGSNSLICAECTKSVREVSDFIEERKKLNDT